MVVRSAILSSDLLMRSKVIGEVVPQIFRQYRS
jgi:hypothetical protein